MAASDPSMAMTPADLTELQEIYLAVGGRAEGPDARVVVNVANLHGTRLAWDVGAASVTPEVSGTLGAPTRRLRPDSR